MPLRTIGWMNVSGRPDSRIPAVASSSAASAASSLFEAREPRRLEQVALLEDRQRSREPRRHARAAGGAGGGSSDRPFAHRFARLARPPRRSDASFAQRLHELAQQERRPPRCAQAGVDEDRIRSPTERRLDELGDGGSRQRREADHIGGRIGRHRREQLGIGTRLARAGRHDERDVQLLEAREQEGQVAKGGGVCPVRVVDDQAERARRPRGSRTASRGRAGSRTRDRRPARAAVRSGRAREPEQAGRHAGGALQQIGALELGCLGQRRLEQADAPLRRRNRAPARFPATEARAFRRLPPPSAPPRAAPSCRSRPALRSPRTCRAPRAPRRAPTRSAPAPRSARAAVRRPRPFSCASSLLPRAVRKVRAVSTRTLSLQSER